MQWDNRTDVDIQEAKSNAFQDILYIDLYWLPFKRVNWQDWGNTWNDGLFWDWDVRFTHCWICRSWCFGLWRCVVLLVITIHPEDVSGKFLRNINSLHLFGNSGKRSLTAWPIMKVFMGFVSVFKKVMASWMLADFLPRPLPSIVYNHSYFSCCVTSKVDKASIHYDSRGTLSAVRQTHINKIMSKPSSNAFHKRITYNVLKSNGNYVYQPPKQSLTLHFLFIGSVWFSV
jgi:hypothetical protein